MSGEMHISKRAIVLSAVAVFVVAFLGVMAGTKYIEWRQIKWKEKRLAGLATGQSSKLRAGEKIPEIPLVGLDGTPTSTRTITDQNNSLYLFVSVSCDLCTEVTRSWFGYVDRIPPEVKVYGICQDPLEYARAYAQKTGFPFPLYCDTNDVFGKEYYMDIYPTVIGIMAGGKIAFVQHGIREDFTPLKAVEQLYGKKP